MNNNEHRILTALKQGPMSAKDISRATWIAQSNVYTYLKAMREKGLVDVRYTEHSKEGEYYIPDGPTNPA